MIAEIKPRSTRLFLVQIYLLPVCRWVTIFTVKVFIGVLLNQFLIAWTWVNASANRMWMQFETGIMEDSNWLTWFLEVWWRDYNTGSLPPKVQLPWRVGSSPGFRHTYKGSHDWWCSTSQPPPSNCILLLRILFRPVEPFWRILWWSWTDYHWCWKWALASITAY